MKFTLSRLTLLAVVVLALAVSSQAQNRTRFAGRFDAIDYAYGIGPGIGYLQVATGNTSTGTASITVVLPCITAGDGTTVCPLATNAPILVGVGATQDSITPTAVSGCNITGAYGACTITASFTYTHGNGEIITTGSYGIQEAINLATTASTGGIVVVDRAWARMGGTTAKLIAAAPYSNVVVEDTRTGDQFWSMQPSTLTSLAVPTTLVAGTVVFAAAPVGTWANSAYYFCVTYVDALGGEGPCSLTYNQTPTLNYSVTVTAPAASTGAVGWRLYSGASYNAAYLMPIDSTHCTLTTLESVMPACAIGSNGGWIAPPLTTTNLRPNATVTAGALASPTVNLATPQPQGHTTFAYSPNGNLIPQPFQTNYGPFPQFGSTTSGQIDYLGSINLPAGFLNTIGRTVLLKGKLVLGTTNTAAIPTLTVLLSWVGGDTAGVGVTTCAFITAATGSTVAYNGEFECTLTTNAMGATAIGSVMTGGSVMYQVQTGAAAGLGPNIDTNNAVVGSLGLFAQDTVNIVYTSTTNTTATAQLMDLHVVVLE